MQPEHRQDLVEKINQIPNILRNQDELRDLRYPTDIIKPIPYLAPPKPDGLKCRACGHIAALTSIQVSSQVFQVSQVSR
jgi:hypothetical protein